MEQGPSTIVIHLKDTPETEEEPVGDPREAILKESLDGARHALLKAENSVPEIGSTQGRTDAYIGIADRYLHIHRTLLELS